MLYFDKNKAIEEYDRRISNLNSLLERRPDMAELASELMKLRSLNAEQMIELAQILYIGDTSDKFLLYDFQRLLDKDNELEFPHALDSVLHVLSYSIIDDNILKLCRIELSNDMWEANGIEYFLTTDEDWSLRSDIAKKWVKKGIGIYYDPEIVSFEMIGFNEKLENFTEFIKALLNDDVWNDKGFFEPKNIIDEKFFNKQVGED